MYPGTPRRARGQGDNRCRAAATKLDLSRTDGLRGATLFRSPSVQGFEGLRLRERSPPQLSRSPRQSRLASAQWRSKRPRAPTDLAASPPAKAKRPALTQDGSFLSVRTRQRGRSSSNTKNRFLCLVEPDNRAIRYGIGVGRGGFQWLGEQEIWAKEEWPDWRPPQEMIGRQRYPPRFMAGARAIPWTLERSISAQPSFASTAQMSRRLSAAPFLQVAFDSSTTTWSISTHGCRSARRSDQAGRRPLKLARFTRACRAPCRPAPRSRL